MASAYQKVLEDNECLRADLNNAINRVQKLEQENAALKERIDALMAMDLYGAEFCPWCTRCMRYIEFGGESHDENCALRKEVALKAAPES